MKKNFLLSLGVQTVTNALECHNLTARESTLVGIHAWRHGCLPACSLSLSYDVPSEARSTSSPVSFHLIRIFESETSRGNYVADSSPLQL
ncbi:uncharacterized protein LOC116213786 isoform X3 [Punica granatum]|uniref:Uncharacterized protein LOC116213786 isoform X3 n=1 Tax=Punica granatum TaxID=22663 RepID=A0A6P8EH05_PUNGR|nr:uncharacterized protein LOC116213786 isoform X3 [Punica granatum]